MTLDSKLIRAKDVVLIVGAISGMIAGIYHVYAKPFELQVRMDAYDKKTVIYDDDHEKIITLVEKLDNLAKTAERIEKKVDKIQ